MTLLGDGDYALLDYLIAETAFLHYVNQINKRFPDQPSASADVRTASEQQIADALRDVGLSPTLLQQMFGAYLSDMTQDGTLAKAATLSGLEVQFQAGERDQT